MNKYFVEPTVNNGWNCSVQYVVIPGLHSSITTFSLLFTSSSPGGERDLGERDFSLRGDTEADFLT